MSGKNEVTIIRRLLKIWFPSATSLARNVVNQICATFKTFVDMTKTQLSKVYETLSLLSEMALGQTGNDHVESMASSLSSTFHSVKNRIYKTGEAAYTWTMEKLQQLLDLGIRFKRTCFVLVCAATFATLKSTCRHVGKVIRMLKSIEEWKNFFKSMSASIPFLGTAFSTLVDVVIPVESVERLITTICSTLEWASGGRAVRRRADQYFGVSAALTFVDTEKPALNGVLVAFDNKYDTLKRARPRFGWLPMTASRVQNTGYLLEIPRNDDLESTGKSLFMDLEVLLLDNPNPTRENSKRFWAFNSKGQGALFELSEGDKSNFPTVKFLLAMVDEYKNLGPKPNVEAALSRPYRHTGEGPKEDKSTMFVHREPEISENHLLLYKMIYENLPRVKYSAVHHTHQHKCKQQHSLYFQVEEGTGINRNIQWRISDMIPSKKKKYIYIALATDSMRDRTEEKYWLPSPLDCFSHYEALNLDPTATLKMIKKAYRALSLRYHPDKNLGREKQAEAEFRRVSDAYSVLKNAEMRKEHDLELELDSEKTKHGRKKWNDQFANNKEFNKNGEFIYNNKKVRLVGPCFLSDGNWRVEVVDETTQKKCVVMMSELYCMTTRNLETGDDYRGHRVLRIDRDGEQITNISVMSRDKYVNPGFAQSHVLECFLRITDDEDCCLLITKKLYSSPESEVTKIEALTTHTTPDGQEYILALTDDEHLGTKMLKLPTNAPTPSSSAVWSKLDFLHGSFDKTNSDAAYRPDDEEAKKYTTIT